MEEDQPAAGSGVSAVSGVQSKPAQLLTKSRLLNERCTCMLCCVLQWSGWWDLTLSQRGMLEEARLVTMLSFCR